MKIIVIGAGELGRLLAKTLCEQGHDVVILDSDYEELERLGDKLDIQRICGSCTSIETLKKAGIETTDALIAVSGDEAANILSCQLASRFGIKQTICRLFRSDSISEKDGITHDDFGIWATFSTPESSVRKIFEVLNNNAVLEKIRFGHPDACMAIVRISSSSQLLGMRLSDIACGSIFEKVRIAAVLHGSQFLIPHGNTILGSDDKIYIAGRRDHVETCIEWVTSSSEQIKHGRIVIAGAGVTGMMLAQKAASSGYDVRLIEPNKRIAESVLDDLESGIILMHGDPTDEDLLDEAGVSAADVFVSAADDDENNILSCIISKRLGAGKVVALTHKPEYIRIVPTMDLIDCGFSATLTSVNTILRFLGGGTLRLDANLMNFGARLAEFNISSRSPLLGKALKDCVLPPCTVLALIFRKNEVITPTGTTCLELGDTVVTIVTRDTAKRLEPLFPKERS
ncbi:MAG: Trk system potassium transporter TrkA [Lentisphaeria bacterium]|nr:Trk system potassium transporter TrkA [Lentisphaeria bacterium]